MLIQSYTVRTTPPRLPLWAQYISLYKLHPILKVSSEEGHIVDETNLICKNVARLSLSKAIHRLCRDMRSTVATKMWLASKLPQLYKIWCFVRRASPSVRALFTYRNIHKIYFSCHAAGAILWSPSNAILVGRRAEEVLPRTKSEDEFAHYE